MSDYPPAGSTITKWHDKPVLVRPTDTVTVRDAEPKNEHVPIDVGGSVYTWVHVERIAEYEDAGFVRETKTCNDKGPGSH